LATPIGRRYARNIPHTTLPAGSMIQDSATEIRHCQDRYLHRATINGDPTLSGPVSASDHLASRIHDPGLCNGDPTLSGPVSASGKTIANHKADLGTSCLSVSLTMTINGDPALSGPVSAPHRHFIPSRAGTTRGSWKMVVGMFGQKECWRCWLRSNILYINSD